MEKKFMLITSHSNLSPSENYLVDWIENNVDFFLHSTIQEISDAANVSTALITKTIKKLDYKNFAEFKLYIQKQKTLVESSYSYKEVDDPVINSINYIRSHNNFAIQETLSMLNKNHVEMILDEIKKANHILVYGAGSSGVASEEFSQNFRKIGKNAFYSSDYHKLLLEIPKMQSNDMFVIFSNEMRTIEIKNLLKIAESKKIKVTAVTSSNEKNLLKNFHNIISHKNIRQKNRITALSSKTIQLIIADIIFSSYVYSNPDCLKFINEGTILIHEWNKNGLNS